MAGTVTNRPEFGWEMKSDDLPDQTFDSGMGTLPLCRIGPGLKYLLPETMLDRGTLGVHVSTPILKQSHRVGSWSGSDQDCLDIR